MENKLEIKNDRKLNRSTIKNTRFERTLEGLSSDVAPYIFGEYYRVLYTSMV